MLIGIDIDEVIADSVAVYLPTLNALFGKDLRREDLVEWDFERTYGVPPAEIKRFWAVHARSGGWERIRPTDGAAEILARLRERHEVVVVTGRPEEHVGRATRAWLAAHRIPHDALVFMEGLDKDEAVRRAIGRGLDVLVEDHADFALAVAARGVPVFLVDAPWNRRAGPHPLVRRVADLREAADLILAGDLARAG